MTMNEIMNLLQNLAFPAFVSVYLLINSTKNEEFNRNQLEELRKTVDKNTNVIAKLIDKLSQKDQ
jgi:hypothetical protein